MIRKCRCPRCKSTNTCVVYIKIENTEFEVANDFLIGTRVTERAKKKLIKADKVQVYKCNDCDTYFESRTVLSKQ